MKVAFIRDYFAMGGIETVLHNNALDLKEFGFEFYAICTGKSAYKGNHLWDTYKEVKVIILPNDEGGIYNEENQKALIDIIKQNGLDLICYDYRMGDIIDMIHKETNAKTMFWMHSTPLYLAHSRRSGVDLWMRKYPILSIPPISWTLDYLVSRKFKSETIHYKYLVENSDIVSTLNEYDKIELIEKLKLDNFNSDKIKVLINPIEINSDPKLNKEKRIIFMGRFEYRAKRIERFVDIWKLIYKDLPDWRLELYGDGDSFDMVKEEIQKAKLERIYLMGRTDNPNEVYDRAAIVALTSQFEGWGMVLAEGQNNGCVPIAFASAGGIKTVIKGGGGDLEAGVLATPFKIKEYAEKLKNLCLNEEYRKELQKNALIKRNEYLIDQNIETWKEIKRICKGN